MASTFDVELPFLVRDGRRHRLTLHEVSTYRDIALTRGHAGRGLGRAKDAFRMGDVEATRLVDIMRQVDVSAAGSLDRHDFSLALDRAGVKLPAADEDNLFRSLSSARTNGIGCDIEMFAHLVNFWSRNELGTTPVAVAMAAAAATRTRSRTAAGRREGEQTRGHIFPGWHSHSLQQRDRPPTAVSFAGDHDNEDQHHRRQAPLGKDAASFSGSDDGSNKNHPSTSAGLRKYAAGGREGEAASNQRNWVDNIGLESAGVRTNEQQQMVIDQGRGNSLSQTVIAAAAGAAASAAAGKPTSFSVKMNDIMNHNSATAVGRSVRMPEQLHRDGRGQGGDEDDGGAVQQGHWSPAARGDGDAEQLSGVTGEEKVPPDQAYIHSLGYGNLGSVLQILLDRRSALEASLDRLDRVGSGRVRPGDFMAAVRQVGIALSAVQEANMMDLLHRMGAVAVPEGEEHCQWIDAFAAISAISLAAEKAGGRSSQATPRSPAKEGTRLLNALSERYADVHVSLLPSSILLGPNAFQERQAAADDGAGDVFVTSGLLRNGLRKSGVLLGDTDERILWRLLLRRAQETLARGHGGSGSGSGNGAADEAQTVAAVTTLLARGMIPLPLLDAVMGFDADEALRVRRQLQQLEAHPPPSVSAAYRDHLGPWAGFGSGTNNNTNDSGDGGDDDDDDNKAPLLLQKARLQVKALGGTKAEREQAVLRCLPKLGPSGEQQRLLRVDLTRVLQQLRVGVRSGELQNLWYHMDRNQITRQRFRHLLVESTDNLPVTFPASPCPYPAGPIGTAGPDISYAGDSTPKGGISVTGARLQQVLSHAAYKDNVTRGAGGSAMTRALQGGEGDENRPGADLDTSTTSASASPPSNNGDGRGIGGGDANSTLSAGRLPVLLQRAVNRVKELGNGEEVVSALVPDMGRVREGMPITRSGIQRALHGLGIIPHSGELQQLWWSLEKGRVGDPRISVQDFRSLLQGRTTKLVLLKGWNALGDAFSDSYSEAHRGPGGNSNSNSGGGGDGGSPVPRALREVRTSLGLCRRRVGGIVRGCEDRDLPAEGWVTEEAFFEVLKDQGILQQLGDYGLSALRQAVVVENSSRRSRAERGGGGGGSGDGEGAAVVRYTGLVGAIDDYLEAVMSWDKSEMASRLGLAGAEDDDNGADVDGGEEEGGRRQQGRDSEGGRRMSASQQQYPPPRSAKKTIPVGVDSLNTVARAARGWDNDAPVVPAGMRHFPQKSCTMAGLVGNSGFGGRAVALKRERRPSSPYSDKAGISAAMADAFQWDQSQGEPTPSPLRNGAAADAAAAAVETSTPQPPMSAAHTTPQSRSSGGDGGVMRMNARAGNLADGRGGERGTTIYDICGAPPTTPTSPPSRSRSRSQSQSQGGRCINVDAGFLPAGGASGLDRPEGSSGRRGSAVKDAAMAGDGVGRVLAGAGAEMAGEEPGFTGGRRRAVDVPPSTSVGGNRAGSPGNLSVGFGGNLGDATSPCGGIGIFGNEQGGDASSTPRFASRRQSSTGQLRGLVEAWPEEAAAPVGDQRGSGGRSSSNAARNGNGSDDRTEYGHSSPDALGDLERVALERRKNAARTFLRDRALLAGVFRQLAGDGGQQGLDKARLVKLFLYERMLVDLSRQEAEDLAEAVLHNCGAPTARFASLTTFLAKVASGSSSGAAYAPSSQSMGDHDGSINEFGGLETPATRCARDDYIAQSIRLSVEQSRSELRMAGGGEDGRLSCAVHLRRAFRKKRKDLGGDPGIVDDCSVAASDLRGVLQDMGVTLNPTQVAFLIEKCRARRTPGRRPSAGGLDESPVMAGDVLGFFRELLS